MRVEIEGAKKGKVMKLESFFDFPEDKMFSNKKKIHALLLKFFFKNHQCNNICKKLLLKKHKYQELPDRTDIKPECHFN